MKYTIMEFKNGVPSVLLDSNSNPYCFDNDKDADIERIYLQPDHENLLKTIMVVGKQ